MNHSIALAVLTAGLMVVSPVRAADITPPMAPKVKQTERDGWTFAIAPYFWAAGMSGDAGLFGLPTVHLDMDFGYIWKDLDFAAMAIAEARYVRYSLFTDILYTKISSGRGTPRGI
jgi:hypothetical protein